MKIKLTKKEKKAIKKWAKKYELSPQRVMIQALRLYDFVNHHEIRMTKIPNPPPPPKLCEKCNQLSENNWCTNCFGQKPVSPSPPRT